MDITTELTVCAQNRHLQADNEIIMFCWHDFIVASHVEMSGFLYFCQNEIK